MKTTDLVEGCVQSLEDADLEEGPLGAVLQVTLDPVTPLPCLLPIQQALSDQFMVFLNPENILGV
jgi:hypothetical protein